MDGLEIFQLIFVTVVFVIGAVGFFIVATKKD